ncbi:MAG: hypothetical protein JWL59_3423 [Chthoniobacteraceae bacterium]|nr:hypothetical protein [Chthoniobacteraceae bacterium]
MCLSALSAIAMLAYVSAENEIPEQANSSISKWVELTIGAVVAGFGPFAAYAFELGRASTYGILPVMVRPDSVTLLSFALASLALLGVPAFLFMHAVVVNERQVLKRPVKVFFGITFAVAVSAFFVPSTGAWTQALFSVALLFVTFAVTMWIVSRISANLKAVSPTHRYVHNVCLATLALISIAGYLFYIGLRWERSQTRHLVLQGQTRKAVIARIYGDQMICAQLDQAGEKLTGRLFILKAGIDKDAIFSQENTRLFTAKGTED